MGACPPARFAIFTGSRDAGLAPFIFHMHLSQSYLQDKGVSLFILLIFSIDTGFGDNNHLLLSLLH